MILAEAPDPDPLDPMLFTRIANPDPVDTVAAERDPPLPYATELILIVPTIAGWFPQT